MYFILDFYSVQQHLPKRDDLCLPKGRDGAACPVPRPRLPWQAELQVPVGRRRGAGGPQPQPSGHRDSRLAGTLLPVGRHEVSPMCWMLLVRAFDSVENMSTRLKFAVSSAFLWGSLSD